MPKKRVTLRALSPWKTSTIFTGLFWRRSAGSVPRAFFERFYTAKGLFSKHFLNFFFDEETDGSHVLADGALSGGANWNRRSATRGHGEILYRPLKVWKVTFSFLHMFTKLVILKIRHEFFFFNAMFSTEILWSSITSKTQHQVIGHASMEEKERERGGGGSCARAHTHTHTHTQKKKRVRARMCTHVTWGIHTFVFWFLIVSQILMIASAGVA